MDGTRRKTLSPALAALAAALALNGCQTMGDNATSGAAIGTVAGCLGGAIIATSLGGKPAQGCATGAVIGGATGYVVGRQKDLELAQRTHDDIKRAAPGVATVQLATRKENVPPAERGQVKGAETVEVVDTMVVNVPQALVARKDERVGQTLGKVGGYVSGAEASSRVVVSARSKAEYDFMVASIQQGYTRPADPPKVVYEFRPQTRSTQSAVEVVHAT